MNCLTYNIIFLLLLTQSFAAPSYSEPEEIIEDPELTGGFFEGDMEIEQTRNGLIATSRRWPSGIVRYKIDEIFDVDHVLHILTAMKNIENVSCVRFLPVMNDKNPHILFTGDSSGCHANVGYLGKAQNINLQLYALNQGCFRLGTIMHEILHGLGFYHQQSASDRDDFVLIVAANIQDGKEHNFNKYGETIITDFGIEYDYGSVLHYSSTAFSKNGLKTIIPLQGADIEIGQRLALSSKDIAKLNLMYNCPI